MTPPRGVRILPYMSDQILIPYNSFTDPEFSAPFIEREMSAKGVKTLSDVGDLIPSRRAEIAGAVVIHRKTLEQAMSLAESVRHNGFSVYDEVVLNFCVLHAIRVIGDPPRDDLFCGSVQHVTKDALTLVSEALGTAVERYDCMGAFEREIEGLTTEANEVQAAIETLREFE